MEKFIERCLSFSICIILLFNSFDDTNCFARDGSYVSQTMPFNQENPMFKPQNLGMNPMFNVQNYGARGDGSTDDTAAFGATWKATCGLNGGVMVIPSGYTFLLQPIIFEGSNCQPNIVVQMDGKIVAPPNKSNWKKQDLQWILFARLKRGITIKGNGVFDGQGESWWIPKYESLDYDYDEKSKIIAPHAIRIVESVNVTVKGITVQNSPRMHIYFDACQQIQVYGITVSSPEDSTNTDGIHFSSCQHVNVHDSILACGDDCVSIQTGCSDIEVYNVTCGPGHGYSIGGLGFADTEALVSDVRIRDSTASNSLTGVRIKTWQGGTGSVQNVNFSNIIMTNVKTAITIDQFYCGESHDCKSKPSAVVISGITYENITGTYSRASVSLICSEFEPCKNLKVVGMDLQPSDGMARKNPDPPRCSNAYGKVLTQTEPSLDKCLLSGEAKPPSISPVLKAIKDNESWQPSV